MVDPQESQVRRMVRETLIKHPLSIEGVRELNQQKWNLMLDAATVDNIVSRLLEPAEWQTYQFYQATEGLLVQEHFQNKSPNAGKPPRPLRTRQQQLRAKQLEIGVSDREAIEIIQKVLAGYPELSQEFKQFQEKLFRNLAEEYLLGSQELSAQDVQILQRERHNLFLTLSQANHIIKRVLIFRPKRLKQFEQLQKGFVVRQLLQPFSIQRVRQLQEKQQELHLNLEEINAIAQTILSPDEWQIYYFCLELERLLLQQPMSREGYDQIAQRAWEIRLSSTQMDQIIDEFMPLETRKRDEYESLKREVKFSQNLELILEQPITTATFEALWINKNQTEVSDRHVRDSVSKIFSPQRYRMFEEEQQKRCRQAVDQRLVNQPLSITTETFFRLLPNEYFYFLEESQVKQIIQEANNVRKAAHADHLQRIEKYDRQLEELIKTEGMPLSEKVCQDLEELRFELQLKPTDVPALNEVHTQLRISYIRLWRYLKAKNWKQANEETFNKLLEIGNCTGWMGQASVPPLTMADLETIDRLWLEYSGKRFGFSVQSQIWQQVQPKVSQAVAERVKREVQKKSPSFSESEINAAVQERMTAPEIQEEIKAECIEEFCNQVGWRCGEEWLHDEKIDYKSQTPGHLPFIPLMNWWRWANGLEAMLNKFSKVPPEPTPSDFAPCQGGD